ncbi:glycosyltransferase family 4 protein [Bacillus atrophaeus]|uniref:glycosyltransferase family 4 protein n=1 Tax=Bacillus atrophaeus TaxID=1452 RepID=UPI001C63285F|nr:glycosyltransferase family 4 protein [Bacillus atrophaeus]MED4813303.1 glycosyltransferase family 4 protein [Bacillus atrophaeus]MED4860483.1 glycosyltransferase family 4 protein [Bacillus atrophaeus]QYG89766.1 glycosyltransferase family 4 protein [Bacillus atrophaeus]
MKLAFICTEKLPSPAIRGGAIQMMIDGVAPYFSSRYELTIYSIEDPDLPQQETKNGVRYIHLPKNHYREAVANELRKSSFDLIHVFNRPLNVPLYKKAAPNSRVVLSLHNEMFSEKKLTFAQGKEVIKHVSMITTVSTFIKQTVIERFPEAKEKIKVVYSGVDLPSYPPVWTIKGARIREEYRKKYELEDKKVILFAGRLSPTKGPHLLIHSMKRILEQHKNAVLVIAGGKWFSDDGVNQYVACLRKLAKPYKEHVLFTNFIPANEIPNLFLMADVFVCSSQWNEPLARVNYEAMAAGTPLITTNRGGNGEVVKHEVNGLVIENYDKPSSFAKAVDKVFTDMNLSKKIARNGRNRVEASFTFLHAAKRLDAVYQSVLQPLNEQYLPPLLNQNLDVSFSKQVFTASKSK